MIEYLFLHIPKSYIVTCGAISYLRYITLFHQKRMSLKSYLCQQTKVTFS